MGKCIYSSQCQNCDGNKKICRCSVDCIVCGKELLENSEELEVVAGNGLNTYFKIKNSNTVIVNVEDDYCVLCDYCYEKNQINLCDKLERFRFTMQVTKGNTKNERAYVKCGTQYFHEYIHRIAYGDDFVDECKSRGLSLDHLAETYDHRLSHTVYNENMRRKSHRVQLNIRTSKELAVLISDIRNTEAQKTGLYFDIAKEKVNGRNRGFVVKI